MVDFVTCVNTERQKIDPRHNPRAQPYSPGSCDHSALIFDLIAPLTHQFFKGFSSPVSRPWVVTWTTGVGVRHGPSRRGHVTAGRGPRDLGGELLGGFEALCGLLFSSS